MLAANPSSSSSDLNQALELDFLYEDEAWYSVRLLYQEEKEKKLIMKYSDFSDVYDQVFSARDFKDRKKLDDFVKRFRPTTVQVQDYECNRVVEGMTVSACLQLDEEEVKFFDAVVDKVCVFLLHVLFLFKLSSICITSDLRYVCVVCFSLYTEKFLCRSEVVLVNRTCSKGVLPQLIL